MLGFDIAGQHCVVLGAGGIGVAAARAVAELGAEVTVADRSADAVSACAAAVSEVGGIAHGARLDVADADAMADFFATLVRPPDIVVNTAGVIEYTSLLDQDPASLQRVLDVNLRGAFLSTQHAAARMRPHGGGAIVHLSSVAAYVSSRLPAAAYSMTKAGVRQLVVAAAAELAPLGIRVNAVAPATIDTPFVQDTLTSSEQREEAARRSPMGRIGTVEDVVGSIVFLASPLSSFITGHTLVIDGGRLTRAA